MQKKEQKPGLFRNGDDEDEESTDEQEQQETGG